MRLDARRSSPEAPIDGQARCASLKSWRSAAALYPQTNTVPVIDGGIGATGRHQLQRPSLHRQSRWRCRGLLSSAFSGFPNVMPPPGLYHRILQEIESPLTRPWRARG